MDMHMMKMSRVATEMHAREALEKAHRTDLIGFDKKCLIRPKRGESFKKEEPKQTKKRTIRNVHKKKKK